LGERRCRHCDAPVSAFYPAVEIASLGVAVWAAVVSNGSLLWVTCALGWCLLALAAIDLRDGLLPDALTLPLAAAGLVESGIWASEDLLGRAAGAAGGFAALWAIREIYYRIRGRDGLGLGDIKLFAAAGAWVSWEGLPSVLLFSSVSTLLMALVLGRIEPSRGFEHRIPFGPGLAAGIWLAWLYGPIG
jgi:leader peptidase (prepilin peptidase)/N-methyltransferase